MVDPPRNDTCPVFGVLSHPSMVDFPGRMAAVLFTAGCNFGCGFCHNAELLRRSRAGYSWDTLSAILERFREQWVHAVVLTGGEPLLAPEILALIRFIKQQGFAIKLDTNGSFPDVLAEALSLVQYVAMDVKCGLRHYPEFVKFDDPARIAESVALIKAHASDYEFRTTVIECFHDEQEMREVCALIKGARRYVLQPFLPRDDLPDPELRSEPRTSPAFLERLADMMSDCADEIVVRGS